MKKKTAAPLGAFSLILTLAVAVVLVITTLPPAAPEPDPTPKNTADPISNSTTNDPEMQEPPKTPDPPATPTPSATPKPSVEPDPKRVIDPDKPMIALTYDDGPSSKNTPKLLDLMEQYNVTATFFEIGEALKSNTRYLERMEALGCEVANHTYDHIRLTTLTAEEVADEIERTNVIIRSVLGHDAALVRPPYGTFSDIVLSASKYPLITWTIDTLDWSTHSAASTVETVKSYGNLDGQIILMHSTENSTVDATAELIPWLISKGYQIVTVSEMAKYRGVEMTAGVRYKQFTK